MIVAVSTFARMMMLCAAIALLLVPGTTHAARRRAATAAPAARHAPTAKTLPPGVTPDQKIVVHRNAGSATTLRVSLGIPFPPGAVTDSRNVRILDEDGAEVPAAVATTLKWFFKDGSVRAVRVQFRAELKGDERTFYFALGRTRTTGLESWPYADGLAAQGSGPRMPEAIATLTPQWLCASLIAGPQTVATSDEPYAAYVARQFEWARALPDRDPSAWLFDRPTALFKAYVRSGRFDYLQAALLSYRFYMAHVLRVAPPMSMKELLREQVRPEKACIGGWSLGDKSPCDVKYVYVEPILLALALSGDDSEHDDHLIEAMVKLWNSGGWNPRARPYEKPSQYFTERLAGLGLLEIVNAYELTGDADYRKDIDKRILWLQKHQSDLDADGHSIDGLGDDGSWRNSWNVHENDADSKKPDVRGTSPWMSENIIDGLWHAWLVTSDSRIPGMITGFGQYLERYGWIDPKLLKSPHDWRNPCSGPDGQIAWYWSSAHASTQALKDIQESEGWYSDAHNVELALPVAAARYFETDAKKSAALSRRLAKLASSWNLACAADSNTIRRFNWNNRGSGVVQWLMQQPAGAGAPAVARTTH